MTALGAFGIGVLLGLLLIALFEISARWLR